MLTRSFINHHLHCTIIILFTLSHNVDEKKGQEIIIIIIYLVSYNLFFQNKHKFLYIMLSATRISLKYPFLSF